MTLATVVGADGLGVAVSGSDSAAQRAGKRSQRYLQGGDHPAVGRLEHARPMVRRRLDRHPPEDAVQNSRDAGVTVYTIQVNTSKPADPTSTVLSQCASDPSNFYMLTSATLVVATFKSIGTSLSK